jgi:hypothetical protein
MSDHWATPTTVISAYPSWLSDLCRPVNHHLQSIQGACKRVFRSSSRDQKSHSDPLPVHVRLDWRSPNRPARSLASQPASREMLGSDRAGEQTAGRRLPDQHEREGARQMRVTASPVSREPQGARVWVRKRRRPCDRRVHCAPLRGGRQTLSASIPLRGMGGQAPAEKSRQTKSEKQRLKTRISWLPLASQNDWEGESTPEERKDGKCVRVRQRKSAIGREGRSEDRIAIAVVLGPSTNAHRSPHR